MRPYESEYLREFKIILRPYCFLRGFVNSFWGWVITGCVVDDGHKFKIRMDDDLGFSILECETCGYQA
jgi:hypothetical protein